jgi:hypothetical protein
MNRVHMPFPECLADACGHLLAATDRECLRREFDYRSGLLRGYYLAGAICDVELRAALEQLRGIHHDRFMATSPDIEGRDSRKAVCRV